MNVDELSKLILFVAISASCVGISFQIMRLLGAVTENVHDLRKSVKNLGIILEEFAQDQKLIRSGIESIVAVSKKIERIVDMVAKKIVQPLTLIFGFLSSISTIVSKFNKKIKK